MKKTLSLILATLFVVLALASCNNNPPKIPDVSTPGIPSGGESQPVASPGESSGDESTPIVPDEVEFTACDEEVYVTGDLNLRTSTSFDADNVAKTVDKGTKLRRIGFHETWSKVVFEDTEYFCSTAYLSKELPAENITFTDVDETLYVCPDGKFEGESKLYTEADRTKEASITIAAKTAVKRTGVYYENPEDAEKLGWSRIEYEGATYYIRNSQLTETAPTTPAESAPAAESTNAA